MVSKSWNYNTSWKEKFQHSENPNWNMAILFLERLDKLLQKVSEARWERNLLIYYTALHELWTSLSFKVVEPGEEEIEKDIDNLFIKVTAFFKNASSEDLDFSSRSVTLAETQLNDINKKINILLYRYGLLYPIPKHNDPKRAIANF